MTWDLAGPGGPGLDYIAACRHAAFHARFFTHDVFHPTSLSPGVPGPRGRGELQAGPHQIQPPHPRQRALHRARGASS